MTRAPVSGIVDECRPRGVLKLRSNNNLPTRPGRGSNERSRTTNERTIVARRRRRLFGNRVSNDANGDSPRSLIYQPLRRICVCVQACVGACACIVVRKHHALYGVMNLPGNVRYSSARDLFATPDHPVRDV